MHEDKKQTPTSYRSLKSIFLGEYGIPLQDASMVLMDVPLDLREVRKILPLGFWPTNPPMATLFVANYPIFAYGEPYRGALMMVHVTPIGTGIHCNWILVDNDAGLRVQEDGKIKVE